MRVRGANYTLFGACSNACAVERLHTCKGLLSNACILSCLFSFTTRICLYSFIECCLCGNLYLTQRDDFEMLFWDGKNTKLIFLLVFGSIIRPLVNLTFVLIICFPYAKVEKHEKSRANYRFLLVARDRREEWGQSSRQGATRSASGV